MVVVECLFLMLVLIAECLYTKVLHEIIMFLLVVDSSRNRRMTFLTISSYLPLICSYYCFELKCKNEYSKDNAYKGIFEFNF